MAPIHKSDADCFPWFDKEECLRRPASRWTEQGGGARWQASQPEAFPPGNCPNHNGWSALSPEPDTDSILCARF